jgi:hypothetical protein
MRLLKKALIYLIMKKVGPLKTITISAIMTPRRPGGTVNIVTVVATYRC